jgi:PhnB protein
MIAAMGAAREFVETIYRNETLIVAVSNFEQITFKETPMKLEPYLNFDGRCDEAIEFYKGALGAKVIRLVRFKESPEKPPMGQFPPEIMDKVMHANLQVGDKNMLMSDGRCGGQMKFSGISLAISVPTEAEADRTFAGLSDGGKVTMPQAKTFFSPRFGMVTDRFGIGWMVIVE